MYRFAGFTLDPQRTVLAVEDAPVVLPPKAVEVLLALVERAPAVTTKRELMDRLWPEGFVEEGNLTQYVYLLRRAFAARNLEGAIETVPRCGYRFTLPIADETPNRRPRLRWRAAAAAAVLVVASLVSTSSGGERTAGAPLSSADRERYALGRYYWSLRTVPALRRSLSYFRQVVRDAPHSALGYSGLADAYLGLYDYACDGAACAPYRRQSMDYARRAVRVDAGSSPAHASLAMTLRVFESDYARSDAEFRRAIALDPQNAVAYEWYGNSLLVRGRVAAAREALLRAAQLDPVSPATFGWLARTEYYARSYARAIYYAREALAIDPSRNETRYLLVLAYDRLGDRREAAAASRRLDANAGNNPVNLALRAIEARRYDAALDLLKRVRFSGDTQRAFLALDPRLDPVRRDPRFAPWTATPPRETRS